MKLAELKKLPIDEAKIHVKYGCMAKMKMIESYLMKSFYFKQALVKIKLLERSHIVD